jgi:flagellar hook-basal body complex protein FliE
MAVSTITNTLNPVQFNTNNTLNSNNDGQQGQAVSFGDYLKNALDSVNQLQLDSEQAGLDFAAGKTDNIHDVMIAGEKADIALQLTMQIRNKVVESYNEIMRMQI